MNAALSSLASEQSEATTHTIKKIKQLLNYPATYAAATVTFTTSDMQLKIHSDSSYLSEQKARSCTAVHSFLGNKPPNPEIKNNGAILNPTGILRHVVSSAAEAEFAGLFVNGKEGTVVRNTLENLRWKQEPTEITTDNTTADGITNDTVKQNRSKAMDMSFYWIRDRIEQKQFSVIWQPGDTNLADYFTKHHPAPHYRRMRRHYLANMVWCLLHQFTTKQQTNRTQNKPKHHCEGVLNPRH
jgi:hypothetical protein